MSDQCYNWNGKLWKGLAPKSPFGSACGKRTCEVCPNPITEPDPITETVGNGKDAKKSSGLESCHPGGIIPTKWDYIKSRGGECGGQGNWSSRNRALGCGPDKAAKPLSCSIAQDVTSRNDRLTCLSIDSNSCPMIDGFQPNPKWTKSGYPDCNGGECTKCDQIYNSNPNKVDCTYGPLTTLRRLKDHKREFPQDKKGIGPRPSTSSAKRSWRLHRLTSPCSATTSIAGEGEPHGISGVPSTRVPGLLERCAESTSIPSPKMRKIESYLPSAVTILSVKPATWVTEKISVYPNATAITVRTTRCTKTLRDLQVSTPGLHSPTLVGTRSVKTQTIGLPPIFRTRHVRQTFAVISWISKGPTSVKST